MKNIPEGYLGFICLPELITGNGTYKTRCGELVIIDQCPEMPLMDGLDVGGYYTVNPPGVTTPIRDHWNRSGRMWRGLYCDNDIVEKVSDEVHPISE